MVTVNNTNIHKYPLRPKFPQQQMIINQPGYQQLVIVSIYDDYKTVGCVRLMSHLIKVRS
jgi:hypothetical protein